MAAPENLNGIDLADPATVERVASCGGTQRRRQPLTEAISTSAAPCLHLRVNSDGFCLDCGVRAAIALDLPKRQPLTEPIPEATTDRRQGSYIHIGLLGAVLSTLDEQGKGLSLARQIATLECALRIVKADQEEPVFPESESHHGGCQGHA